MRQSGILLAVSSLPNQYGIGDFSSNAYEFIDALCESGCKIWQILPLNPLGYGNSPYQPYSSYAMDELYIGLDHLVKQGLIKEVKPYASTTSSVNYEDVKSYKQPYLKEAFQNFKKNETYDEFCDLFWVHNYAVFLSLKRRNDLVAWADWPQIEQNWVKDNAFDVTLISEEIEYEKFIQFTLLTQWKELKAYANKKGISIMGDIPFYVGHDSEDVWSNQSAFLLDDDGRPEFIAGVPPDYFSETGQRWGNPIYNWEYLEKTDFEFWKKRLMYNCDVFDILRIDHFRAFDTYWEIPATCDTAIEGEWIEAPGEKFFSRIMPLLEGNEIVAEDLGDLRPEVLELRDQFGFKGMNIVQFTFDPELEDPTVEDRENMITYLGTHDNQTTLSWFEDLEEDRQELMNEAIERLDIKQDNIVDSFIEYALMNPAEYAILSMQDILMLSDEARMNVPSTIGSPNWQWRMISLEDFKRRIPFIKSLVKKSNRV